MPASEFLCSSQKSQVENTGWCSIVLQIVYFPSPESTIDCRLISDAERDSMVVRALDAMMIPQKTKKARVYIPSRESCRGSPNQCKLSGSTTAKISISTTPAIKKAGHAIHINLLPHIVSTSLIHKILSSLASKKFETIYIEINIQWSG